ncbi:MAG: N4-gp56 family major capsid protein [Pisciglobus halotolerans]|nr:N4-gp56 family major capsid protein [Pisciglobus halotolerans]MDN6670665.1 N4-gp56 family major capsid protein [Staphylococcus equorum]
MATGQTKLAQLIDPEVMAEMVSAELPNLIRFTPLATVNTDLQGRAGSTLNFPTWDYIGTAKDIAEGEAIPLDQMGAKTAEVSVKKAAKGTEITDEAALSGLGDPIGEANKQLAMAIADKVDDDLIEAAKGGTQSIEMANETTLNVEYLQQGLDKFDDEEDVPTVIIANPKDAALLRADAQKNYMFGSDIGAEQFMTGSYGEVLGAQIIRSRKVKEGEPILVRQGALSLVLKRNAQVETDRDIIKKTTVITADEHYAAYLYNKKKVVKFTTALV